MSGEASCNAGGGGDIAACQEEGECEGAYNGQTSQDSLEECQEVLANVLSQIFFKI